MTAIKKILALPVLAMTLTSGLAFAQDRHDDHFVRHEEWRKGSHINHDDWNRAAPVDYRRYHLSAPPRGYEWRQVDGNYVLAAAATGLIASAIVASTVH